MRFTHPGFEHKIRYITPIEQFGPEEFLARCKEDAREATLGGLLVFHGPDLTAGYTFAGVVELVPCLRRSGATAHRPVYLFLAKLWDNGSRGRKEVPTEAQGLEVSPEEFATEMRRQKLIIATDRYANGRIYFLQGFDNAYRKLLGIGR